MKKYFALVSTLFLTACSLFGIQSAQEAGYEVQLANQRIEIRLYTPLLTAQTDVAGDYKNAANKAFNRLFLYITGNNKKQQKIAMTAPVFQEQQSEEITMTTPVLQEKTGQIWLMSFVLPGQYSLSTAPIPLDPEVRLKELPAKKIAVIRYSGSLSEQAIEINTLELKNWLLENGYKSISNARSAAYDPPWTLPFLRRNEVHIDIE
jgi:hypothetical protein